MLLYNKNEYSIFYESDKELLLCYKNNQFFRLERLMQQNRSHYELRDEARNCFETWINNKPKPTTDVVSF